MPLEPPYSLIAFPDPPARLPAAALADPSSRLPKLIAELLVARSNYIAVNDFSILLSGCWDLEVADFKIIADEFYPVGF